MKSGCPYCVNSRVWVGFNDLKTKFPDLAKDADGWDASTFLPGSNKKMPWKCDKGHTWKAQILARTHAKTGCPECAEYGFDSGKPAWFYLMKREGEQQFGITNHIEDRIKYHSLRGWGELQKTGPHVGYEVVETEKKLKRWLRKEVDLIDGTSENWYTSNLEVHSLAELKEKSGIETTIF